MFLPELTDAKRCAFFFDFDGTLTEIAERPDAVRCEPSTQCALAMLYESTTGAVAIVTGREIEEVDRFLFPLKLPVAGVHGFERRAANGHTSSAATDPMLAATLEERMRPLIEAHKGLFLERKRAALALHYRLKPELEDVCAASMEKACENLGDVTLLRGKMVIEARFHQATKGTAITDFLAEDPFHGRTPVAAGDDVTDEDAFRTVNAMGGASIKVGTGATVARHRADGVAHFLNWLTRTAETLKADSEVQGDDMIAGR